MLTEYSFPSVTSKRSPNMDTVKMRRSVLPGKSTRMSVAGKRQPKFYEENENHVVETHGGLLPIIVADSLHLGSALSGGIDGRGLCYIIAGRYLHMWSVRPDDRSVKKFSLPASEISVLYRQVSITTFPKTTSLVFVSPAGIIRIWKSTGNPSGFSESTLPIKGHEVHSVVQVTFDKIIVCTTNAVMYFVETNFTTRELKAASKSGLTSRFTSVASYFLGSDVGDANQFRRLLVPVKCEDRIIYLTNTSLTQVSFVDERVTWSVNLPNLLNGQICDLLLTDCERDTAQISFIDASLWSDECDIILLCCVWVSTDPNADAVYILCHLHDREISGNFAVNLYLTGFKLPVAEVGVEALNNFELVLPDERICEAFLVNEKHVIRVALKSPDTPNDAIVDLLDFSMCKDRLLGFGVYDSALILLSPSKGLVKFTSKGSKLPRECQSTASLQDTLKNITDTFIEPSRQLRQIFIIFGDASFTHKFVESMNDFFCGFEQGVDNSALDTMVVGCAKSLADDSLVEPDKLQAVDFNITAMFEEKRRLLTNFLEFLEKSGLTQMLCSVVVDNTVTPTLGAILELIEKLDSLAIFHAYHSANPGIFDSCIQCVVQKRGNFNSYNDWMLKYYKVVSQMDDIFPVLTENQVSGNVPFSIETVLALTNLQVDIQKRCLELRKSAKFGVQSNHDFVPWSISSSFYKMITDHLLWANSNASSDIALDFYQSQSNLAVAYLNSVSFHFDCVSELNPPEEFLEQLEMKVATVRKYFVKLFRDANQISYALSIAEKFLDFQTLIEICSSHEDLYNRIEVYRKLYEDESFDMHLFRYLYNSGQWGKLVNINSPFLNEYLKGHPNLSWVAAAKSRDFLAAVQTLLNLADKEVHNLYSKKTLLSFAKLYALRARQNRESLVWKTILKSQQVAAFQEHMPQRIKELYAFDDIRRSPVLSVEQLINFYVTDDNDRANEDDFMAALTLLRMLEPDNDITEKTKFGIWSQAVAKTDWSPIDSNNPDYLSNLTQALFCKILAGAPRDLMVLCSHLVDSLSEQGLLDDRECLLVSACYDYVVNTC